MVTRQHTATALVATFLFALSAQPGQAQVESPARQRTTPANVVVRQSTDPDSYWSPISYRVHAYMNPAGKLHLLINNPERLRYKIEIVDQYNRSVYEEFTNHDRYNRRLDLSALPENACQVIVNIDNQRYRYKVNRQGTQVAYTLQAQPIVSSPSTEEPHPDKTERPTMPVTLD